MTNNDDDLIKVIKPFGPSIAKIKMPDILVDNLNKYVDRLLERPALKKAISL